jgi:hypothetical protein
MQLRRAKKPKWWHHLLGIAVIMGLRRQRLIAAVNEAAAEAENLEKRLAKIKSSMLRDEFAEQQRHLNLVRQIAKRKSEAIDALEQIDAANCLLRKQPALAYCGWDFVLRKAQGEVNAVRQAREKADATLDQGLSIHCVH